MGKRSEVNRRHPFEFCSFGFSTLLIYLGSPKILVTLMRRTMMFPPVYNNICIGLGIVHVLVLTWDCIWYLEPTTTTQSHSST